ncbi:MAG: hypothetical protein IJQ45_02805 [Clostridia bacterium]|nr:hypothetical protein [Clostridia bacterium]
MSQRRSCFGVAGSGTVWNSVRPGIILVSSSLVAQVDDFCLALPRYKRPRKLIFAKVPRNPTGKIEKPLLRERYGATRLVEAQMKG